jgi:hypothetical protein
LQSPIKPNIPPKQLPSASYLFKLLARHGLVAALITLPVAALVALGLSRLEIQYSSQATVVYDPRDSSINSDVVRYPEFSQIANTYLGALQDKSFLKVVGRRLGYYDVEREEYRKPWFKKQLTFIMPQPLIPQSWLYGPQEYKSHVIQSSIKQVLKGQADHNAYELKLEGRSSSPPAAQHLVKETLDAFITFQLRNHVQQISANLETFEDYLTKEKRRLENMADIYSIYDDSAIDQGKPLNLSRTEKKRLKNRERDLITKILDKQEEVEQTFASQVQRKLEIESDLQSLLTRLGPTHPEVVQKKEELADLEGSNRIDTLNQQTERMTRNLLQLQAKMKRASIPIDLTLQLRNLSEEGQLFVNELTQRVKEFRLEKQSLQNQLENPSSRTRYRFTKPPTLESSPGNKKWIAVAVAGGIFLVLGTMGAVIIFREFFNPVAYDAWRVLNRYHLPAIAQVPKKQIKQLKQAASPKKISQMKKHLDDASLRKARDPMLGLLQNLRRVEQAMHSTQDKGSHALVYIGQARNLREISETFGNICATDQDEDVILIDFNHLHPIHKSQDKLDLNAFLRGECKWKEVKLPKSNDLGFDYAKHSFAQQDASAIRHETLHRLITALKDKYGMTILNGFPGSFFVENAKLVAEADSWVAAIVLGDARFEDIETVLQYLDSSKLRGLLLINT